MIGLIATGFFTAAATLCYGLCRGSKRCLKITETSVETACLEKGQRLRILHMTDLHGNSEHCMNLDIWPAALQLDVDMAVITGDVIVNDIKELHPHLDGIRKLAQKMPVFFVDGNHEKFFVQECQQLLEENGVNVLYNTTHDMEIGSTLLTVIGFRDYTYLKRRKFQDIAAVFQGFRPDQTRRFVIVLTHQPQLFPRLAEFGVDLVLAGHTHGGQVRLPLFPVLYAPGQGILPQYGYGLYKLGGSRLFVSKGIGTTHFPIRFWNRPELAVITVKRKV